jgi:hypothetical protein
VVLLKYTMPEQPLSSRLSLAQTYVSVTSRARAISLGIENGQSAEELGMGIGQATVKIMGKELRVLKRWGYGWRDDGGVQPKTEPSTESHQDIKDEQTQIKPEPPTEEEEEQQQDETTPPLWGLDLEALKKAFTSSSSSTETPILAKAQTPSTTNMPIHTPQAARAYLLKSFDNPPPPSSDQTSTTSNNKKPSSASKAADKERNLGMLLRALDLLYQSWIDVVGPAELDRRVWGWYIRVRPAVEQGVAGWGGKGEVKLSDILGLRRGE